MMSIKLERENNRSKQSSKLITLVLIALILATSIIFAVQGTYNVVRADEMTQEESIIIEKPNMNISNNINTYAEIYELKGTYRDASWNGRVYLQDIWLFQDSARVYYIDINVDPRNGITKDIVIEYRHYTKGYVVQNEVNESLPRFDFEIVFLDSAGKKLLSYIDGKSNDNQAAFIRNSGLTKGVAGVIVKTEVKTNNNVNYVFHFEFGESAEGKAEEFF